MIGPEDDVVKATLTFNDDVPLIDLTPIVQALLAIDDTLDKILGELQSRP